MPPPTPTDEPTSPDPAARAAAAQDGGSAPPPANPFDDDGQADQEADAHGRIGYSRYGRASSIGLAAVIILVLVVVAIVNRSGSGDAPSGDSGAPTAGIETNRPAPGFSLTLFDGRSFTLADQRGKIVVMNFWASWCGPCKEEMPVLEQAAASAPDDVVFVGVGARNDDDAKARQFATDHGVTYAIGRDTEGGDAVRGGIEQDYRIPAYPATFVIDAEGNIVAIKMGRISPEELDAAIAKARG